MYPLLKQLHVAFAALTIAGFLLRGYWMLTSSELLGHRITRIAPHIVDTLFLLSGIAMLVILSLNPLTQSWLIAKFAGLLLYIVFGTLALRRGRTPTIQATAFISAVVVFAYIVGVALTHSASSWIALL